MQKYLKVYIKMEKIIKFGDLEIDKQKFVQHKIPIKINKLVVSHKVSFGNKGFKYLAGYKVVEEIYLFFYKWWWIIWKIKLILEKVKSSFEIKFDSEPV